MEWEKYLTQEKNGVKMYSVDAMLDDKFGKEGSPERAAFTIESLAWYFGTILRERRKMLKLTQKELAERIGKERAYIAKIEKGETDMQLSSFLRIAMALGLYLDLSPKS
jgi:HTH-type transcriptional regulator/antitoxin HipB